MKYQSNDIVEINHEFWRYGKILKPGNYDNTYKVVIYPLSILRIKSINKHKKTITIGNDEILIHSDNLRLIDNKLFKLVIPMMDSQDLLKFDKFLKRT